MKTWLILMIVVVFTACTDSATVTVKTDSVGTKIEEKAEKVWDTAKENLKETGREIRDKVKDGLDNVEINIKRDSTEKNK